MDGGGLIGCSRVPPDLRQAIGEVGQREPAQLDQRRDLGDDDRGIPEMTCGEASPKTSRTSGLSRTPSPPASTIAQSFDALSPNTATLLIHSPGPARDRSR
jgi:hypothetical protein